MADRLEYEPGKLSNTMPPIDTGSHLWPYRNSQIEQEKGPPPTEQPRSNRPKFPWDTTSKDWWPTDVPKPKEPVSKEDKPLGYGVHWADQPRIYPQMPGDVKVPPVVPPGPGPVDGPIRKPDIIQPPRMSDEDARKSVNINADARSIYATAALTGLGMGAGTHYADIYTGAIAPESRTGLAAFWRNNLSPSQRLVPERTAILSEIQAKIPGLEIDANAAAHTFDRHVRFRTELMHNLANEIPTTPLDPREAAWYRSRVELIQQDRFFSSANIRMNAGTEAEVAARTKLFTNVNAEQMAAQADEFWQANRNSAIAGTALEHGRVAQNQATQMLYQAERSSITTRSQAMLGGIGKGLLIASGTVLADNLMDRALGNSPELSNSAHWGLQGIGMPLLLLSKASTPTKVIGSLAMVGVSHLMDKQMGPPTGIFSAFARPSLPEIGLATAGALMPVQDTRIRAGLAIGGWALGKTWNYFDAKYELTGRTEPRFQYETLASVDADMKAPTLARFQFAQEQMRNLADRNDAASSVLIKDWQASTTSKTAIDRDRGTAALMMGQADSLLARGSRIDRDQWSKTGITIGAGLDYDLGGQASSYIRAAAGNLGDAIKLAKENKGRSIESGVIDDAYIAQLTRLQDSSTQSLNKIYGEHDIKAVYKDIASKVRWNTEDMKTFGENLAQYEQTLKDSDPKFKAKINRDLAMIHLAFGEAESTPAASRNHFDKANYYYQNARKLDPTAADLNKVLILFTPLSRE